MNAINTQLTRGSQLSLRKRASYAMGSFAVVLNQPQLNKLVQLLLAKLTSAQEKSDTIIQLQCLSIIAKSVGNKLAPHLEAIVPILNTFATRLNNEESVDEDNELAESALTTLEAIIRKCANDVTSYIPTFISNAFQLTEYDPNYTYFDDEDEKMEEDEEGWGDDDEDGGWGAGDDDQDDDADDDTSWKVRRAAVGIIDVIVKTRPDVIKQIIMQHADSMVDRVKERNTEVKVELLKVLQAVIISSMEISQSSLELDLMSNTSMKRQLSMGEGLKEKQPVLVKALIKPLKSKKDKVKVAAIEALSAFALLTQFEFDASFNEVWDHLKETIDNRQNYDAAISALGLLRRLFRSKTVDDARTGNFTEKANEITEFLIKAIEHNYSKVVFEGLRVASSFLSALRTVQTNTVDARFAAQVNQLNAIVLDKLGRVNIDTEVKHSCLLTAASIIMTAHPILGAQNLNNYFTIFADRLSNELTREAALKGLTMVALNSVSREAEATLIAIQQPELFLPPFYDLLRNR